MGGEEGGRSGVLGLALPEAIAKALLAIYKRSSNALF